MSRLLISEEAFWDIKEAIGYYSQISESISEKFKEQLSKGLDYIVSNPLTITLKYKIVRSYNLRSFPYQIHFIYEEERVMIVGVFHGKSNPKSWEDRLDH